MNMKPRVFVVQPIPEEALDVLREVAEVTVYPYVDRQISVDELVANAKRCDYLLRYRRDFMIAVVEAKPEYKKPGDGLQQAKDYAQILGLNFAYSTNGHGIVEHDFLTGKDNDLQTFPPPEELPLRHSSEMIRACSPKVTHHDW